MAMTKDRYYGDSITGEVNLLISCQKNRSNSTDMPCDLHVLGLINLSAISMKSSVRASELTAVHVPSSCSWLRFISISSCGVVF